MSGQVSWKKKSIQKWGHAEHIRKYYNQILFWHDQKISQRK